MSEFVTLGLAISVSMLVNILFGSIDAIIGLTFDYKLFLKGILKAIAITFGCLGLYFVGTILPEIVIPLGAQELTIQMALHTILLTVAIKYVIEAFNKLLILLNVKEKFVK